MKVKYNTIRPVIHSLFEVKQTERLWHIPVLASLCVGIPLLVGLYFNQMAYGILASTSGLVILHLPATSVANRMVTMLACSFGFMLSFTTGIIFSFHWLLSSLVLGLLGFGVQWVVNYFGMKPPGGFFFVMIASIASCMPFNLAAIPVRVGIIGMGAMLACTLGFIYSLYIIRRQPAKNQPGFTKPGKYDNTFLSGLTGIFMGLSLLVAHLLKLQNPYWVPISCMAVMQGASLEHIWSRSLQRILGTFVGLGLAWLLLLTGPSPLMICMSIFVLQFIIEMLVVRHYGLAVIFITTLTLFLAEAGSAVHADLNILMPARFVDIALGSIIGAIAGWFIHHEQLRKKTERQIRISRILLKRNRNLDH